MTTRQKSECQAECQVFELRVEGEVGVVRTEDEDLVRDFLRPLDVVRDTHAIVELKTHQVGSGFLNFCDKVSLD